MKPLLCFAAILTTTLPAMAFTGAELVQADRRFGEGFVFGAVSSRLEILSVDPARQVEIGNCVSRAKILSGAMLDTVTTFIQSNPDALPQPATYAVLRVLDTMCPKATSSN